MSDRPSVRSILGGAFVVVLSGVAAWVGAGLARRDELPAALPRTAPDAATAASNDRRFGYIEKRLDLVEETARTALEIARSHAPSAAPGDAAAPTAAGPQPTKARVPDSVEPPVAAEPDRNDGADGQMANLKAIARGTAKGRVVYQMNLFTDATEEGIANRRAQALADARTLAHLYGLKGDDAQATIQKAFQEQWDRGARDIGPIVHDGLEKADVATVRERLAGLYAETDRRLRPLFDDDTWKAYEAAVGGLRRSDGEILDEFEKVRLGGK